MENHQSKKNRISKCFSLVLTGLVHSKKYWSAWFPEYQCHFRYKGKFLFIFYMSHCKLYVWPKVYWHTVFSKRNATLENLRFFWRRVFIRQINQYFWEWTTPGAKCMNDVLALHVLFNVYNIVNFHSSWKLNLRDCKVEIISSLTEIETWYQHPCRKQVWKWRFKSQWHLFNIEPIDLGIISVPESTKKLRTLTDCTTSVDHFC